MFESIQLSRTFEELEEAFWQEVKRIALLDKNGDNSRSTTGDAVMQFSDKQIEKYQQITGQLEQAVGAGGVVSKQAQKDLISKANRVLEDMLTPALRREADRIEKENLAPYYAFMEANPGERDGMRLSAGAQRRFDEALKPTASYQKVLGTNSVRVDTFIKLEEKFKKAATKEPENKLFQAGELFDYFRPLVELGLQVKGLPIQPKQTKQEQEAQRIEAAWKSLPTTAQHIVDAVVECSRERMEQLTEERIASRVERMSLYQLAVEEMERDKEASGSIQEGMKIGREHYNRLVARFGGLLPIFERARGDVAVIKDITEKESEYELLKIKYAAIDHLRGVDVLVANNIRLEHGNDGVEGSWSLTLRTGDKKVWSFRAIWAGGHNIQKLHTRTIFSLK